MGVHKTVTCEGENKTQGQQQKPGQIGNAQNQGVFKGLAQGVVKLTHEGEDGAENQNSQAQSDAGNEPEEVHGAGDVEKKQQAV